MSIDPSSWTEGSDCHSERIVEYSWFRMKTDSPIMREIIPVRVETRMTNPEEYRRAGGRVVGGGGWTGTDSAGVGSGSGSGPRSSDDSSASDIKLGECVSSKERIKKI